MRCIGAFLPKVESQCLELIVELENIKEYRVMPNNRTCSRAAFYGLLYDLQYLIEERRMPIRSYMLDAAIRGVKNCTQFEPEVRKQCACIVTWLKHKKCPNTLPYLMATGDPDLAHFINEYGWKKYCRKQGIFRSVEESDEGSEEVDAKKDKKRPRIIEIEDEEESSKKTRV